MSEAKRIHKIQVTSRAMGLHTAASYRGWPCAETEHTLTNFLSNFLRPKVSKSLLNNTTTTQQFKPSQKWHAPWGFSSLGTSASTQPAMEEWTGLLCPLVHVPSFFTTNHLWASVCCMTSNASSSNIPGATHTCAKPNLRPSTCCLTPFRSHIIRQHQSASVLSGY